MRNRILRVIAAGGIAFSLLTTSASARDTAMGVVAAGWYTFDGADDVNNVGLLGLLGLFGLAGLVRRNRPDKGPQGE